MYLHIHVLMVIILMLIKETHKQRILCDINRRLFYEYTNIVNQYKLD